MPFDTALDLDRRALDFLERDVHHLDDRMLTLPTPCDGWTVRDLINHMNVEHVAVCGGVVDDGNDPRTEFSSVAARWLAFFQSTNGRSVHVPKMGADIPSELVLSVHVTDMIVHRWDLTTAVGFPCAVPAELLDAAAEVAEMITAPGSALVGPNAVYKPSLGSDPTATPLQNLVRTLGRDHRWSRPA